jgi:serine/tyrosine/threonine adenylyltransferase
VEHLRLLTDYTIQRHDPQLLDRPGKYLEFFRAVADRQASLIAHWQLVGFIHGVMNTDNMAISGETIDFGPCAFMNTYRPETVFSSIDHGGRYAYGNQPLIAQWNLARFAECLLPLIDADAERAVAMATEALGEFPARFEAFWRAGMRRKLGLDTEEPGDADLMDRLLGWMETSRADFTHTFRQLSSGEVPTGAEQEPEFREWHARWQLRLDREARPRSAIYAAMRCVNPAVIPRNHRVEEALSAAQEGDDLAPVQRLLAVLSSPFEETPDSRPYQEIPLEDGTYRTFCGT